MVNSRIIDHSFTIRITKNNNKKHKNCLYVISPFDNENNFYNKRRKRIKVASNNA